MLFPCYKLSIPAHAEKICKPTGLCISWSLVSTSMCSPTSYSLLELCWPTLYSLNLPCLLLLPGLHICYSLCLECCSPGFHSACSLASFQPLLKHCLIKQVFSEYVDQNATQSPLVMFYTFLHAFIVS